MKSIEVKLTEALEKLKKSTSASKYKEVCEKLPTLLPIEAALKFVEEKLKITEANPLGLNGYEEFTEDAKRDFPALFGVEPREVASTSTSKLLTEAEKAQRTIKKHNGVADNHGTGTFTESSSVPNNICAKGDAVMIEYMTYPKQHPLYGQRLTEADKRKLLGEKPAEYANLSESQRKEFHFNRMIGISEADCFKLAKITGR